ncbi:MAG: PAS domain S-box protein [Syntrophales bacterium]|nr:PAS domain S-box protein [Syntrophales bacterium]
MKTNSNIFRMLSVVFFILVASFIITSYYYYLSKDKEIKAEAHNNLAVIADLKIRQITNWRNEREGDAQIIQNTTAVARLVKNYFETKSHEEALKRWAAAFCEHKVYSSATILDTRGAVRFAYGEGSNEIDSVGYSLLKDVLKQKKFALSDLHVSSGTKKVTLDLLVPLILWEQKDHPVAGVFLFKVDPYKILYPLLQSWPTPSPTSETLLIRREGEEVVYLNELRFKKGPAIALRLPIARMDLPAAMAARGAEGMVEGVDYRGVPVLAAIRKVPNSPWLMVVKVDKAEAYDPLHHELLMVALVTALLIIASGAILGLWWRHQRAVFYRTQYQSEIERRALIEHFSYLAKYANDMIFLFDKRGRIIEVNDRACIQYGYRREELLQPPIPALRPPELQSGMPDIWRQVDENEGMIYETEHVRKNGTRFPVEISARGFDIEGNRYIQAIIRDITERKHAESALSAEKERLTVTLKSIGDGVITTDVNGNITLLNKVAEELTGWSLAEAMGRPLCEVFHIMNELTRERCENPVDKVLKSGVIIGLANHTALIRRDGREMAIADSGAPIRDGEGKVIGVVLVFRDITDKQKTGLALQNAEKLEAIGLLAGGIAHDFNNLLSGIFGYVDMARMQAEKGGNGRGIENALSKACGVYDRAKYLTHQLLIFSKGGSPVRKTQSIVEHVQKAVSFALSGSNVSPVFAIPDEVWPCDFDENQIAQVFDNIVINARQAMPLGGELDVAVRNISPGDAPRELPPCAFVCISICDYGSGISKVHMPRIFDPFFTTKQQGSGLGLATSHSIVKKHDGLIHAESELGKGTTFRVYLPASSGQISVPNRERKQLHRGHGRILIMDDEEFILDVVSEMLTAMGYHVIAAINGDEAIAHARSAMQSGQPFRAAILDLTIPGGRGGKETVHALLEIDRDIKVVASSGYSEDPVMSKPSDYGFAGQLAKPYLPSDLILLLESLLRQPE